MKRIYYYVVLIVLMCTNFIAEARSPFTSYSIKATSYQYGEKTAFQPANNTVVVSSDRITVHGTMSGTKYWYTKYLGTTTLPQWGNKIFHKFYLTSKNVYFYVSDQKIMSGPTRNSTRYYVIVFNGEIQLAL